MNLLLLDSRKFSMSFSLWRQHNEHIIILTITETIKVKAIEATPTFRDDPHWVMRGASISNRAPTHTWLWGPRAGPWGRTPSRRAGGVWAGAWRRPALWGRAPSLGSCRCHRGRPPPRGRRPPCRGLSRWRRPGCPVWSVTGTTQGHY